MTEPTMEPAMIAEEQPMAASDEQPAEAPKTAKSKAGAAPKPKAEKPAKAGKPVTAEKPGAGKTDKPAKAGKPATAAAKADDPTPAAAEDARAAAAAAPGPKGPRGLHLRYASEVVPALVKQFEYRNPNQVPKLAKIVVNVGLGEALTNAKAIDAASHDIVAITGQKPIVTRAKRSIAQFHVRANNPIGLKVTLRGQRMWDFLERLVLLTLPRIRDFRGIPSKSFDGRGNYSLGMREQIAFPEIDYDKVDRLRGLEISIVTTAKSDEESKRLLELLGMPFAG
jgi:large subunit ribosomal protein L5